MIGGALCVVGALLFGLQLPAIRQLVRPIYAQIGIIPEIAEGLQAVSSVQQPPE